MKDPLLAPLAAVAAGVVADRFLTFDPRALVEGVFALAALSLAAALLARPGFWKMPAAVGLAAAGALVAEWHRPGPAPQLDAASGDIVILEGCVVEPPAFGEDREQFVLELEPGARVRVTVPARADEKPPRIAYGQRVELVARVRTPRNFRNPGSFDYEGYLARRRIYWLATTVRGGAPRPLAGSCGSTPMAAIFGLRSGILDRIDRIHAGHPYAAAMMRAILVGDSSKLERSWTEDYRRTGTYHAIVVSGLHIAVLAGVLLFLLRVLCVPPAMAWSLTAAVAWIYALTGGWQPPVVRSAAGFSLYLAARLCYRRGRILNLLAAVALGFVLLDPEQIFEASFQLSFLAVAAIGALAAPWIEATSGPFARGLRHLHDSSRDLHLDPPVAQFRVELRLLAETLALVARTHGTWALAALGLLHRAAFWTFEMLLVSGCVQLAMALPMVVYFHRVPVSGLPANLLVVPLMNAVIPIGFLAVATEWSWLAMLSRTLLDVARTVAAGHVRLEPEWRVPDPPLWVGLWFAAALLLAALAPLRKPAWIPLLAALAVLLIHPFAPRIEAGALELTMLDVGQGESLFLALPGGRMLMVDGGGVPGSTTRLDIGEDVVSPYLWTRSIRRLDVLVSTHGHEDHIGGLAALLANFKPSEIWTGATAGGPALVRLERLAARRGVRVVRLAAGTAFDYGGAKFEVLAPPSGDPSPEARNDDSLVLRVNSLLLTGDISASVERTLDLRPALLLKVPHHGSRTSTSDHLLEAARPAFAFLSGQTPHPVVLARLASRGVAVYRTDVHGLTTLVTRAGRMRIER